MVSVHSIRHPYPPPNNFLPAGAVTGTRVTNSAPNFITRSRIKGKRRAGLVYEAKAHEYLAQKCEFYIPGPWIAFTAFGSTRIRYCQPDGLILDFVSGKIVVVEIKLKHVRLAWWQLRHLYEPVVKALFGGHWTYAVVEVTKTLDPHTPFPERFRFIANPTALAPGEFGVFVYNPGYV